MKFIFISTFKNLLIISTKFSLVSNNNYSRKRHKIIQINSKEISVSKISSFFCSCYLNIFIQIIGIKNEARVCSENNFHSSSLPDILIHTKVYYLHFVLRTEARAWDRMLEYIPGNLPWYIHMVLKGPRTTSSSRPTNLQQIYHQEMWIFVNRCWRFYKIMFLGHQC